MASRSELFEKRRYFRLSSASSRTSSWAPTTEIPSFESRNDALDLEEVLALSLASILTTFI